MEKWKDIPGYEGYYQVSNLGRIKSLPRTSSRNSRRGSKYIFTVRERILKPGKTLANYLFVNLSKGGEKKAFSIHVLVLTLFVGPCPQDMECCHENGNPGDNRLANLRWDTYSQNSCDMIRHRRGNTTKVAPENVTAIRKKFSEGLKIHEIADLYEVSWAIVNYIVKRKTWKWVA